MAFGDGRVKKPYWKRWWFEALIAIVFGFCVIVLILFLLWSGANTPESDGSQSRLRYQFAANLDVLRLEDPPRSRKLPDRYYRYGDHYYERRWRIMCLGPARYDAMAEAYELGRPNPCGHSR